MYLLKKLLAAVVISGGVLLAGCASAPQPVVADVPLVHENFATRSPLSAQPVTLPEQLMPGQTVTIDEQTWRIGLNYLSAAQQPCFVLHPMDERISQARLCQRQTQWMYIPAVLTPPQTAAVPQSVKE